MVCPHAKISVVGDIIRRRSCLTVDAGALRSLRYAHCVRLCQLVLYFNGKDLKVISIYGEIVTISGQYKPLLSDVLSGTIPELIN